MASRFSSVSEENNKKHFITSQVSLNPLAPPVATLFNTGQDYQ